MYSPPPPEDDDLEPDEQLAPELLAAVLLFSRARGATNVARLARAAFIPLAQCELLLCRGLATLLLRGFAAERLCAAFTLSRAQLAQAAKAPPFGPEFQPVGEWSWPPLQPPEVVQEISEAELHAELRELLHEEPAASAVIAPRRTEVAALPVPRESAEPTDAVTARSPEDAAGAGPGPRPRPPADLCP